MASLNLTNAAPLHRVELLNVSAFRPGNDSFVPLMNLTSRITYQSEPVINDAAPMQDIHSNGDYVYTGSAFLVLAMVCLLCSAMCYRDYVRRRQMRRMREEMLHRQRIRDLVRAKIAEMEGLDDTHSLRWYMEQRHPVVHFGDVVEIEISPEESTAHQSLRVLYSTTMTDNSTSPSSSSQLRHVEFNMHELLGKIKGSLSPATSMRSLAAELTVTKSSSGETVAVAPEARSSGVDQGEGQGQCRGQGPDQGQNQDRNEKQGQG